MSIATGVAVVPVLSFTSAPDRYRSYFELLDIFFAARTQNFEAWDSVFHNGSADCNCRAKAFVRAISSARLDGYTDVLLVIYKIQTVKVRCDHTKSSSRFFSRRLATSKRSRWGNTLSNCSGR
jgi:hypothetical protein